MLEKTTPNSMYYLILVLLEVGYLLMIANNVILLQNTYARKMTKTAR